jgi:hypothetical protein
MMMKGMLDGEFVHQQVRRPREVCRRGTEEEEEEEEHCRAQEGEEQEDCGAEEEGFSLLIWRC